MPALPVWRRVPTMTNQAGGPPALRLWCRGPVTASEAGEPPALPV